LPVLEIGGEKAPFKGLADATVPLYGRSPQWLKSCVNFRVMPGGYLEARGGFDAVKPTGGTASDPISAGIFTGAHEHTMADGYVWTATTGGTVFSANLSQKAYFDLWPTSTLVSDSIYIFSDQKFSRVVFYIGQGSHSGAAPTFAYEYPTISDWTSDAALTTTLTPDFFTTGEQVLEFADPGSAWVPSVRNGVYGYGVRIRVSDVGGGFGRVTQSTQKIFSDWVGTRQIVVSSADATTGTNNGTLKYYGQSSATAASWNSIATDLFSGGHARTRFASYRNLLYMVNGKDQKKWDNNTLVDIGFTAPTVSSFTAASNVAGAGLNGVFKYAISLGYGPAGEWGESDALQSASVVTPADDAVDVTWALTSDTSQVDKIYVYRSVDLSSAQNVSLYSSFPFFRIATLTRNNVGTLPSTYQDTSQAFPFPPVEMDIVTNAPPTKCRFVGVHKNRLFLAGNPQFPGRSWWSDVFEMDAFNQDENFADFTRSTGGELKGVIEFADQMVHFTEDKMWGVSNVDQDQPSINEIANIGCIAPDSVKSSFGYLCWLSRTGVYVWDGQSPPEKVSNNLSFTFGKMTSEKHGKTRAEIHNRLYDIYLIDANNVEVGRFRYDLVTRSWSNLSLGVSAKWGPLCVVTAPPSHADAGVRHPLYGQCSLPASDFAVYLGEYTTQDNGNDYSCSVDVHFGPGGFREFTLERAFAYYAAASGWDTPALQNQTYANSLGDVAGVLTNRTPDSGLDYRRISAVPSEGTGGTADLVVSFVVDSASGGIANQQWLLSVGVEGSGVLPLIGNS